VPAGNSANLGEFLIVKEDLKSMTHIYEYD
jgi:hypothetical protein